MGALITGVNGFIGSYLAEYLLNKRLKVYGTIFKVKHLENIAHLKDEIILSRCDVRNPTTVKNVVGKSKLDIVFHLAAQSYPTVSWKDPVSTMETNVFGTINLFEAIRKLGINPKILVACSSAEYGSVREREVSIKEDYPLLPLHPYGVSKVAQDLLAYQYFKNFGLNTIRVRIFGTTGPRKIGDVCSDFARQIVEIECKKKDPIMYVGNLEARRDLTDVRDMVRAFWLLMEKGKIGEVYNACSSKAYKIDDILDKFLEMSDADIEVKVDPKKLRPSDEPVILGDNSKIKKDCGWQPKIPIEKTLKDILNYWRGKVHQSSWHKI
jgi:GDP-4-dehydro-6-deoxy-D-mannose reductase